MIGKAEHLSKGANPRFVVTSFSSKEFAKRYVYEDLYCARGEMEDRIKEVQLDLFGDRASCHTFRGSALRLWFAMAAQLLMVTIRNVGLVRSEWACALAGTLRNKLFKGRGGRFDQCPANSCPCLKRVPAEATPGKGTCSAQSTGCNDLSHSRQSKTSPTTCSVLPRLEFLLAQQKAYESHRSDIKQTTEPRLVAWQADDFLISPTSSLA
ncbi:MAG: hypothetical protein GY811_01480 [Myxococcales bacterium]|nr:hypothetical protein [Myxococcales bacterium]